ncbi:ATP-binding protein [Leptolyngbya sp. KIOST-1]|uniref:ATP-binding protein n=1 Tax=Leptolyngbya sp. KIOST-1 TaxID=1229172 RepID=UPI0009078D1E|nr:ATP-binding protein [Leptolyngbya sp. KIOST-1]
MIRPTIIKIENAFLPSREITESERFAGRENAIRDTYYALISEGSNIAIVGNRGVGKTSLARQVINIGTGKAEILEKTGIVFDEKLDFLSIYMACGRQISSTNELLERLLTSSSCLADWIYDIPNAKKIMINYSPKLSANVFGVGVELGGTKETETTASPIISNHSVDVVFTNIVEAISKEKLSKNGLLIVIDEFDQISDPTGFASFIKSLATNCPKVKFCIVGVAKDIQMLMKEHESSDRLFAGSIINMEPMNASELREIISNAERYIDDYIVFEEPAIEKIVSLAQGHPYMVHLIGKFSLRTAFQASKTSISYDDIEITLRDIAQRRADPVLEGKYRKAVASSPQRESVLRAMAQVKDEHGEIWTTTAYKIASDMGVDNASQYVGHLASKEYGEELEKLRERYYRFKDSLFHAYVLARPPMY